jgi:hypothetical protein
MLTCSTKETEPLDFKLAAKLQKVFFKASIFIKHKSTSLLVFCIVKSHVYFNPLTRSNLGVFQRSHISRLMSVTRKDVILPKHGVHRSHICYRQANGQKQFETISPN